jgi:hypothetical protein
VQVLRTAVDGLSVFFLASRLSSLGRGHRVPQHAAELQCEADRGTLLPQSRWIRSVHENMRPLAGPAAYTYWSWTAEALHGDKSAR